jgi:hypothetical protein
MLLRKHLKSLALATSFSRGESYFRSGSVGRITREGNKFTAKVRGTRPYKVQLTMRGEEATLTCSCPYDFEGICKHAVALGLAVIDQFGADLSIGTALPDTSPAALEAALRDTAAAVQLAFLAGLLRQDETLAHRFVAHVAPAATAAPAAPVAVTIDSISTAVYEALSDLSFDDELLDEYDNGYDNYRYDEDDGLLAAADEAIDEVLLPHADLVAEALHEGRLTEALCCWAGVYEGSAAATEPQADDYDLFGYEGYPAHVQARWLELLAGQEVPSLLETQSFAAAETEAALALLVARYGEPSGNDEVAKAKGLAGRGAAPAANAPLRLPPHFYDLLHALAHDPATAARLRPLLTEVPVPDLGLARVLLRVAQVLADDALWLRTSETFAAHDATLTQQLLDRYRERGDHASLRRVLHEQREKFPHVLNPYILQHLTPAEDEALYLTALEQRCRHTHSLPDYHTLQGYWSPARRQAFVDEQVALSQRSGANPVFAAELLLAEHRAAELLPLLRRRNWAWERSVAELLALAARPYPDDCLELVMEKTEALLRDPLNGRGRGVPAPRFVASGPEYRGRAAPTRGALRGAPLHRIRPPQCPARRAARRPAGAHEASGQAAPARGSRSRG